MKGTGFYLTLLFGCLLHQAAANEEQSAVETRRLLHSPVAGYYPGGGYGGGGYGGPGGYGYGPRCYGGYGGYGFGHRGYGGYGGYGCGPRGYGGYGGFGFGGRGCRCGFPGYRRPGGHVFLKVNLHRVPFLPGFHSMGRIPFFNQYFTDGFPGSGGGFHASPFLPGFPSMGKIPFFNHNFFHGFPAFGGGVHASPFLGRIPFFNRYVNYFPSTHHGYFHGGGFPFLGKSFGYHNDFSHFGGGLYLGGYGKGYH